MAAQIRVLRQRIRSVQSTKKITRAFELIATSRIAKAQQRVNASKPYAEAITRAVTAVASQTTIDHPLVTARLMPERVAVLVVSSDRGLAGAYNANVLRTAEELSALLRSENKEPVPYVTGRRELDRVLGAADVPGCQGGRGPSDRGLRAGLCRVRRRRDPHGLHRVRLRPDPATRGSAHPAASRRGDYR